MESEANSRKKFLSCIGMATAGTVLLSNLFPFSTTQASVPFRLNRQTDDEYLFSKGLIYLNTGTLGPCRKDTFEAVAKIWHELELLPLKFYGKFGSELLVEQTREMASKLLGCDISETIITHSTTNGMNALAQGLHLKPGDRILTTDQEHGGGLLCWNYFEKYYGVVIDKIKIAKDEKDPTVILQNIKESLSVKTKLISVSHILSSTGLLMPIKDIATLARENGALCIVDGAQAAGSIPVNVKALGCHAYATSGHKWLMGPKGTGILYLSKEAQSQIHPIQFEESYQTYNNTNGVVNLAAILGLGKAIEYIVRVGINNIESHNLSLRNRLYQQLKDLKNAKILGPPNGALASPMLCLELNKTLNNASFVKMMLDKYQISIRATHKEFGFNGIRFSMHIFNTEKEIDLVSDILEKEIG